tara:strand:- start:189 stop:347 length:159 start_codon:yes stop_codon:yes gene_type:complete
MKRFLGTHRATVIEIVGLAAIAIGVAFVWWPVALIASGLALVILAQGIAPAR